MSRRYPWPAISRIGILTLAFTACGGKAQSTGYEQGAGPGQGGSAAAGGAAALAGGGALAEEPFVPPELDDLFPWFDDAGNGEFPTDPTGKVLHLVVSATPARATFSTHNLFDLLSGAEAVEFSARASEPLRLLVSASHMIQSYDYFAARDGGAQWPLAAVKVGVDWQDFSVPLAEMQPPEVLDDTGQPSFFLAFIVEHPAPVELWLDAVHFELVTEP